MSENRCERSMVSAIENTEENKKKIVKFIKEYNLTQIYHKFHNNCQHFTKNFLRVFGLEIDFEDKHIKE